MCEGFGRASAFPRVAEARRGAGCDRRARHRGDKRLLRDPPPRPPASEMSPGEGRGGRRDARPREADGEAQPRLPLVLSSLGLTRELEVTA